jgi:hypothetical protein
LFSFCYSEEGDDSFATVAFLCFGYVAAKKVTTTKLPSLSFFCFCCNEKGDGSHLLVLCFGAAKKVTTMSSCLLLWFCCNEEM